jgi:predicted PurR-regulated permease PerM
MLKKFFKKNKNKTFYRRFFNRKRKKKSFWRFLKIKKSRKSFLKFLKFGEIKTLLRQAHLSARQGFGGQGKINKFLVSFLFGLILALVALIIFGLVEVEKINTKQKIQSEVDNLSRVVLTEVESDFLDILNRTDWQNLEDKKQLAEKIRHLNYLNAHLQKTINQYYQDWSLKIFNFNKKELDEIFNQVQNIQIISSRITNKIDSSLLFEEISEDQKELIEKDFELFYEKIDLISLAIQLF